jgi:hypothetical protein
MHPSDPPLWRAAPPGTNRRRLGRTGAALGLVVVALLGVLALTADPGGASTARGRTATPANDGRHPWSTDGCSASPERGPGWDFHHACVHHDGCYRGRWASRSTCDGWFLRDVRASCSVLHRGGRSRDLCRFVAAVYHHAVRTFGASAYARQSTYIPLR